MTRCMTADPDAAKNFPDSAIKQKTGFLALTLLGVGEILGGMFIGGIRDAKGYRVAIIV